MTLYLRDEKGGNIFDIEVWVKTENEFSFVEISSSIDVNAYTTNLLKYQNERQVEYINSMAELSEIRGWLWESYFMVKKNTQEEYNNVVAELKTILQGIADRFKLTIVED